MPKRGHRVTLIPLALALLGAVVAACGPEADDLEAGDGYGRTVEVAEPLGEPTTPAAPPVDPASPVAAEGEDLAGPPQAGTVHVTLRDLEIAMPHVLPAGSATLQIHNSGTREHGFAIEGQGLDRAVPEPLQPGESTQLAVDLAAGTYRAYCPVEDHAARGMELELTVEEREGDGPPAP